MFEKYILNPILKSLETYQDFNSFCINEIFYTYSDLAQHISKIRSAIQSKTLSSKTIGLVTNDDIETYATIIAIWLEGYAYVPIHPLHPVERSLEIVDQAGIKLIIDSSETPVFKTIQVIESKKLNFSSLNLNFNQVNDSELAYILFTSGSTGKPKGVPISRSNLSAFMRAFWKTGFKVNNKDRCLQAFDLTFDVSIQSFLVPLSKGACTYTIPHDQIKYSYASGLLEDHKLTFCVMAPSMVRFFKPYFEEIYLPDLRYCILTAEASALNLVEEWSICIPNAEIYDFYGPTEATIYCTYSHFNRTPPNKQLNGMLTIGKPLDGMKAIILDESGNILPKNKKGELCISGEQVTSGYWNNREKNLTSFFTKEVDGRQLRFYKTGDLCFLDDEEDIMYSGRIDFQVKIQGYRIELGEIEHHARECAKGLNVVAIAYENKSGNNEIALFVEGESVEPTDLQACLKSKLPSYMIPSRIIKKDVFPLNKNDKVDRNVLKSILISR